LSDLMKHEEHIPGYYAPIHRALTEPILLGGVPRAVAIVNGTLAAAVGLGLRLWIVGGLIWLTGHLAAVWATKRDAAFVDVVRRHLRYPLRILWPEVFLMMSLAEYRRHAQSLADFLPWAALVPEGVVLNKDSAFQRTARFRGPDLDSSTPAELVATTSRLNNALRRLCSGWAIFVEAQRRSAHFYPMSVSGLCLAPGGCRAPGSVSVRGGRGTLREPLLSDAASGCRRPTRRPGPKPCSTRTVPTKALTGVALWKASSIGPTVCSG
jgi:type IV secretion system protein TrbD